MNVATKSPGVKIGLMKTVCLGVLLILVAGCRSYPPRNPVPQGLLDEAHIPGMPGVRMWGDESPDSFSEPHLISADEMHQRYPALVGRPHAYLALSGGGPMGAFGAGVLNGMTEKGDRPEFMVVTGISAGALLAPFAFLGSEYDPVMKKVFTESDTGDILKIRGPLFALSHDAFSNSDPLYRQIKTNVNMELMRAIAKEHRRGRRLLIGTTHLDANRQMIWNIGAIAEIDTPEALNLIRKVMLASASIPGAFPPVILPVEAEGKGYDEMHVDGGVCAQIFVYPREMNWAAYLEKLQVPSRPELYLIQNMGVEPGWAPVERKTLPIATQGFLTMLRSQGVGDLDRISLLAARDGLTVNLTFIPPDFTEKPEEIFDPAWMGRLFETGYQIGLTGAWQKPTAPGAVLQ